MLSSIVFTVVDGGLGILPPDTGNLQVTVGCCSKGTAGTLYVLGSQSAVTQYLGYGPLAEAVGLKMAMGGAIQYAYVLPQTNTGALSTVTDAAAKATLTSIIAAMVAAGIATNGTT